MRVQCKNEFKKKFMKIEFENTIKRLSFLCHLTDIKIAWILLPILLNLLAFLKLPASLKLPKLRTLPVLMILSRLP